MGRERTRRSTVWDDQRAQSVFDYAVGVSVFLVVVFGVLAFVPTAFGSFGGDDPGGAGDGIAADRAVDHLAGSILDDERPNAGLDTGCTVLFFDGDTGHPDVDETEADCELDGPHSGTLEGRLGLSSTTSANVTVQADFGSGREVACWDVDDGAVVSARASACGDDSSDPADDVQFSAGPRPVDNPEFASAERYETVAGTNVYVVVRVW